MVEIPGLQDFQDVLDDLALVWPDVMFHVMIRNGPAKDQCRENEGDEGNDGSGE
jgi:hypothetical protein